MSFKSVENIFFDLDDTLWDFKRNSVLSFEMVFSKHQLGLTLDDFFRIYNPINAKYWMLYRNNIINRQTLRIKRLEETFLALDLPLPPEKIKDIADDFVRFLTLNNYLLPGVRETLPYLQRKYRLHILTNGFEEVQKKKLKKSGIGSYFETLTASDRVGVNKPYKEIFETALDSAGAQIENSIMIGDNLEVDIFGAENYGLKAIYFLPDKKTAYKGARISAISELKELF